MKSAFFTVLLFAAAAAPAASIPGPTGQFIVVAAPRHPTVSNLQASYRADDPRLVNRIVAFDRASSDFDGLAISCERAIRTTTRAAAGQLIRRIFPDRPNYGRIYVAKPADFGLKLAPTDIVTATHFRCIKPRGNDSRQWTGATLFPLPGGRLALSLIEDHLLILQPATGPVRASFDCVKASTDVERTICSDRPLAGWDRSVAAAYEEGHGDVAEQRAWLLERNKCGKDKTCLGARMFDQAGNLLR